MKNWHKLSRTERLAHIRTRVLVGVQYYRPPQPLRRYWKEDFLRMRDAGIDAARLWVYWRWHERRPGVFAWDELDELFDLGEETGVWVHPLLVLEGVPEWFVRRHPRTFMVDFKGVAHHPTNRKSTQVGGLGVCGNHPLFRRYAGRFLRTMVRRYARRDSLLCWDVWNELQIKSVDGICACRHCAAAYQAEMRARYGTIGALNDSLKTGYGTWEDVVAPGGNSDYAAWFAWRRWQGRSVSRQAVWRAEVIRRADPRQVVMNHLPMKIAVPGHGCGDFDECAAGMDFIGNSTHIQRASGSTPAAERMSARNLLTAEHALAAQQSPSFAWAGEVSSDSSSYHPPPPLDLRDLAYWTWTPVSLGLRGVFYWQFRPEAYGPESPDLGLIELDGCDTGRLGLVRTISGVLRANEDFFARAQPPPEQAAVMICTEQHMASATLYNKIANGERAYQRSILAAYEAFRLANIPARFVGPADIPESVRLLVVPRSPAARPEMTQAILNFVRRGGTAVVEAGFGAVDGESFIMEPFAPGGGVAKEFGVREERPVSTHWYGLTPGSEPASKLSARELEDTWLDAGIVGGVGGSVESLAPELRVRGKLGGRAFAFAAGFERCALTPTTAEVIGRFDSGEPAVTVRQVGKGRVVYIGTCPSYVSGLYAGYAGFLGLIAQELGVKPPLDVPPSAGVTWRILRAGERTGLFVFNHLDRKAVLDLRRCGSARVIHGAGAVLRGGRLTCPPLGTTVVLLDRKAGS